jgi:hypothetical protein
MPERILAGVSCATPGDFRKIRKPESCFFPNQEYCKQNTEKLFVCSLAPPLYKGQGNNAMKEHEGIARGPPGGEPAFFVEGKRKSVLLHPTEP